MTQLVPQAIVTLSPEGELQLEQAINGVRRVQGLTVAGAGAILLRVLKAQRAKIDGETVRAKRKPSQPNWYVIAKHPQVEIRQMLPGRGLDSSAQVIKDKTLEELGL
jgi:hypothetical protein